MSREDFNLSIKPRVVAWCRHYAGRGVRIGYLARLFNLDADALAIALGVQP